MERKRTSQGKCEKKHEILTHETNEVIIFLRGETVKHDVPNQLRVCLAGLIFRVG